MGHVSLGGGNAGDPHELRAVYAFLQPAYFFNFVGLSIERNDLRDGAAGDGKQILPVVGPRVLQQQANAADSLVRGDQARSCRICGFACDIPVKWGPIGHPT